jgi:hypothetical protein
MTQPHTSKSDSAPDALDRLLDAHLGESVELAPSSGFAASVMESIQAHATEPPPIAFPWRRVLPGAIAILCGLLALIVFAIRGAVTAPPVAQPATRPSITVLQPHLPLALTPHEVTLCWILVAACLSIAAVAASFRITGRSE